VKEEVVVVQQQQEEAAPVHQHKPGRPRLHRRQQSMFLPSAMRRSQVSIPNADPDFFFN
jgi:hypothetical protein